MLNFLLYIPMSSNKILRFHASLTVKITLNCLHFFNKLNFDKKFLFDVAASDEFELKFSKLSQAELKRFRAESSGAGAFQFSSWNELTIFMSISSKFFALFKNYNQTSQFCSCNMILINFMIIYLNLCSTKGVFRIE